MPTNPLTIALVAAGAAILGSLLTIFFTPWLQRHFWRKQRRDELRLAAITEYTRLTAEALSGLVFAPQTYKTTPEWFAAFNATAATISVLFSDRSIEAVTKVAKMVDPNNEKRLTSSDAADYVRARNTALRTLYQEVIPLR
jgi:hypothetical protein